MTVLDGAPRADTLTIDEAFHRMSVEWSAEDVTVPAEVIGDCVVGVGRSESLPSYDDVVERIVAVLVGSKQTRFAPRPDATGRAMIRERVAAAVARDEPVALTTMWGAIKHYVRDEDQSIDLAELFAAVRLAQVVRDIRAVYPPGAHLDVVIEDFGVWYEDAYGFSANAQASVSEGSRRYCDDLTRLLRIVAGTSTRTHLFFDLVPMDYRTSIARAERNRELLLAYWSADEGSGGEAYAALRRAGWTGELPPETRTHYLRRLRKLYPHEDPALHVERIVRYFSMVLLYQQVGLLRELSPDAVRLAFYAPAPGPAKERTAGRLHLRVLPKSWCSAAMPPWTSKGCLVLTPDGGLRPRLESFVTLFETGQTFHRGSLRLSDGEHSVRLRMDVVRRDGRSARPLLLKQYAG